MTALSAPTRTVLITGAAQRLGRIMAMRMARANWGVIIHYNTAETAAKDCAETIAALGGWAKTLQTDLADERARDALIGAAQDLANGSLCALVNNAALFERDEKDPAGLRHKAVNADAPLALIRALHAMLNARAPTEHPGAVVNILDGTPAPTFLSSYSASKGILRRATPALAHGLSPLVRVNAIEPGPTLQNPRESGGHFESLVLKTAFRRATDPDDVAAAVQFLLETPTITGATLVMNACPA